jgi:hypothetical protein
LPKIWIWSLPIIYIFPFQQYFDNIKKHIDNLNTNILGRNNEKASLVNQTLLANLLLSFGFTTGLIEKYATSTIDFFDKTTLAINPKVLNSH